MDNDDRLRAINGLKVAGLRLRAPSMGRRRRWITWPPASFLFVIVLRIMISASIIDRNEHEKPVSMSLPPSISIKLWITKRKWRITTANAGWEMLCDSWRCSMRCQRVWIVMDIIMELWQPSSMGKNELNGVTGVKATAHEDYANFTAWHRGRFQFIGNLHQICIEIMRG